MQTKLMLFFAFLSLSLYGQEATDLKFTQSKNYLSIQWLGWSFHPGGGAVTMRQNYPLKLDKKAYVVINLGVAVNYDYELSGKWFLRGSAAYYKDCAFLNAGYLHLGFRWKPLTFGRHSFNGGLGPVLSFREDWHRFETYIDTDIYGKKVWNGWQYVFFPFGGELEYLYKINHKWEFQYSVIPAYPAVITSKIGLRWRI
jgi:hypothetical protein